MATTEIKFRRDTTFRKAVFSPDSFAHPAKMDAQLLLWIVDRYTKPGDTILDPMAGSGTAMLGCTVGRNVVQVELEKKFVDMQKANWGKVRMMPQLGHEMGDCQIIQGDARQLGDILADHAIFSPPYSEGLGHQHRQYGRDIEASKSILPPEYSRSADNIGNLPYGDVDSIITSPPYAERHSYPDAERERHAVEKLKSNPNSKIGGIRIHEHESDNPDNLGNLPYGSIDSVITSPPYEAQVSTAKSGIDWTKGQCYGKPRDRSKEPAFNQDSNFPSNLGNYSSDSSNIGNLKGDTYLSAMLEVYQQCHKVLKVGGLMVVITKNFIRDKKEVRLDQDTIRLCEQAGFQLLERHYRKLSAQSFWRTIYQQKYPDAPVLDKEDILVFQKVANSTV